jgi:hypothetical protein
MHQPVEDRVGHGRIAEILVPALARQLTGDHRRPCAVPVFEDLEQVVTMPIGHGAEAPVIEDEDVDAGEAREEGEYEPSACASARSAKRRGSRR